MTLTGKEIQASRARIDARVRGCILTQAIVRRHDTPDHVVNPLDRDTAIVDRCSQVASEERMRSLRERNTTGHIHIETRQDWCHASVSSTPIGHHWAMLACTAWSILTCVLTVSLES